MKLLLGAIKGAIIGGAVGYGATQAGLSGSGWLVSGVIGAVVGLLVGRPVWSHLLDKRSTFWTPLLKALFGFGIGVGLYVLYSKFLGGAFSLALLGEAEKPIENIPLIFGAGTGLLYGAFVEVDD